MQGSLAAPKRMSSFLLLVPEQREHVAKVKAAGLVVELLYERVRLVVHPQSMREREQLPRARERQGFLPHNV